MISTHLYPFSYAENFLPRHCDLASVYISVVMLRASSSLCSGVLHSRMYTSMGI